MNQSAVFRAVAAATGESVRTIRRRGFSIAAPLFVDHDPEPYDIDPKGDSRRDALLRLLSRPLLSMREGR